MPSPPAPTIYLRTPPEPGRKAALQTYLIYFIVGNPGLAEYYRTFLTHLYGLLTRDTASDRSVEYQVFSRSMSGFEMKKGEMKRVKWQKEPPYGLQDQIRHMEDELVDLVDDLKEQGSREVRVILVGHSVGAYISLDLIRRLRGHGLASEDFDTRIAGAVCLFPTIVDIARSENGVKTSPFLKNSQFATVASTLVHFLVFLLPVALVAKLVTAFMGFPPDAAHTTASFIKSPCGVQQCLHMSRDEMFQIDSDIWDEEVWGAAVSAKKSSHPHPRPILRFLFASKDHWVADATRDALISTRGRYGAAETEDVDVMGEDWKPIMEVDRREGWPHAFCIRHSVPVAERVALYLKRIVAQDMIRE